MDRARYFDHAATTPLDPDVLAAMIPWLNDGHGNAHSLHQAGRSARGAVEQAREHVAALVGAEDPQEIVFTSGATESNNWVISEAERLAISPFEHSSILEPSRSRGALILPNDGYVLEPPSKPVDLVSVMDVNNETGERLMFSGGPWRLHRDITQTLGKLDIPEADLLSASAHKVFGPKGVGMLWARNAEFPEPLLRGGDQEWGHRAGTLNVPAIVGFGEACRIAMDRREADFAHATELRQIVLEELADLDMRVNGDGSPFILSLSFLGIEGETLVIECDQAGFAISSGAACSSRSTEPSHVLLALNCPTEWLRGTVRISFGRSNTGDSTRKLSQTIHRIVRKLRTLT